MKQRPLSNETWRVRARTTTTTATYADTFIPCDASGGDFTLTLPPAEGTGTVICVKNVGASGIVTVEGDGADTIDNSLNLSLDAEHELALLIDRAAGVWSALHTGAPAGGGGSGDVSEALAFTWFMDN